MIQVIQGKQSQINFYINQFKQISSSAIALHTVKEFPSGFYGMRMLIDFLKEMLGPDAVMQKLASDKAMTAFIYPETAAQMTAADRVVYTYFSARFESRLNVPYSLFERLSALLATLIDGHAFDLFIPDIRTIDSESLRVIETCYRSHKLSSVNLFLGFTTDVVDNEDENGIIWERYQGDVQFFAGGFLQHESVQHILLAEGELEQVKWNNYDVVTDEEAAYLTVMAATGVNDLDVNGVIEKLKESYERFSYRAVMKTGSALLNVPGLIDNEARATIHGYVGSAASFYQFTHHANPPFDDYLMYHFTEALKYERIAERRMALYYRISFTCAERRSDLQDASKWIGDFVAELNSADLPEKQKHYHLAWAYNVRGHVYAHTHRFADAALDGENAYELLFEGIRKMEATEETTYNVWLNDYRLSIFNLSIHQVYTGDEENEYDYSRKWFKRMEEIMTFMPRIMLFDTFHWVDYHRNKLDIANALKSAEEGIEDARIFKHGQNYIYTVCAADFNLRLGNPEKALYYFTHAEKIRPVYNDLFYFLNIPWFKAVCLVQLQRYNEAEALFTEELRHSPATDYRVLLISRLAAIAAKQNDKAGFEALMNTAIDEAVELGELNVLVKIAIESCRCLLELGEKESAMEALDKANELIGQEQQDVQTVSKSALFEAALLNLSLHGDDDEIIMNALRLLPEALNDIECWQHLEPFSNHVERLEKKQLSASSAVSDAFDMFHFTYTQQRAHSNNAHTVQA